MNHIDLRGRKAVVTGGASGLGLAITRRLMASGASVTLWDLDNDAILREAVSLRTLGFLHSARVDVTDIRSVEAAAQDAYERMQGIDILVNSAGIAGENSTAWEYGLDAWRQVIEVNLHGTYHCVRTVVPFMLKAGVGHIVNVASVAGKEGNPNASAYSASKGAVIALTKSLGKELAHTDIIANCITPAAIDTPLLAQSTPAFVAYMKGKIPMGRLGLPIEVAAMVAWMCSAECSFSTGAVFDLSGGRSTY